MNMQRQREQERNGLDSFGCPHGRVYVKLGISGFLTLGAASCCLQLRKSTIICVKCHVWAVAAQECLLMRSKGALFRTESVLQLQP